MRGCRSGRDQGQRAVTALDWADWELVPTELIATTVNLYRPAGSGMTRILAVAGCVAESTGGAPVGLPVTGSTGMAVTLYPVVAVLPAVPGVQTAVASTGVPAVPDAAVPITGAPATRPAIAVGVTEFDRAEAGEVPMALVAWTSKV